MTDSLAEAIIDTFLTVSLFGSVFGAIFYIPYRIEKPKKILRYLKYISERSRNDGCITTFDLATEAEISPREAQKSLDRFAQELEGEKLVSAKGEVYYVFPRGEKIFEEETQLKLESATDRKINQLEAKIAQLEQELKSSN